MPEVYGPILFCKVLLRLIIACLMAAVCMADWLLWAVSKYY